MPRTAAFDQHAERYDAWFEQHPAVYASELAAVRTLWPPVREALEVASGRGGLPYRSGSATAWNRRPPCGRRRLPAACR